jgi:opacity protein-like surface antigen
MLKKIVFFGVLASVCVAQAGVAPYLSISGGLSMPESQDFSYAQPGSGGMGDEGGGDSSGSWEGYDEYTSLQRQVAAAAAAGGVGTGSVSYDTGYCVALAAGVAYENMPLRTEFEIGYQKNDVDHIRPAEAETVTQGSGDRAVWTYMVNTYLDIKSFKTLIPFLEFGVGAVDPDDVKMLFAVQMGFGITYPITEHYLLDLKYTYLVSDEYDVFESADSYRTDRLTTHLVQLGLRYQF